jgi:hypothetical protein
MKLSIAALGLAAALGAGPVLAQNATTAHYDLLFRNGTLDALSDDAQLIYDRAVTNTEKPDAAERDTGQIALSFETKDGAELASLMFERDGKHRNIGTFPASVGNPMIMYFYESVIRDMAETAGGSPFYIRNRVKDALVEPAEVTAGEAEWNGQTVPTQVVTLRPFEGDPNAAQMKGWSDLAMTVTMSDEVPGWYLSLEAEVPGNAPDAPIYESEIRFDSAETGQ